MKKIELRHGILIALFMVLTTMVLSTAHLYSKSSDLTDWQNTLAAYFIAIGFECCIFLLIKSGTRWAGAFFAILSFIVGLQFYDQWDSFWIAIHDKNWVLEDISEHKKFYTTTTFLIFSSSLSWILAEKYIKLEAEAKKGIIVEISASKEELEALKQEKASLLETITTLKQNKEKGEQTLSNLESRAENMEEKIAALDKEIASKRATSNGLGKPRLSSNGVH